jgi:D-threonate/D-erythronate kinase
MIVVIADDLSGAAELAGAARQHGLRAEVQTAIELSSDADVVCVDTGTRSRTSDEAGRMAVEIARAAALANPDWIFKKCDSVLRGNVLAEIRAIMAGAGLSKARLISANPARGRTIREGTYYIDGKPLEQTVFAGDPEYPRLTSRVVDLLGGDLFGIETPDAETTADLDLQAASVPAGILAAGGVEFFEALVRARTEVCLAPPGCDWEASGGAALFACGSASAWAKGRSTQCQSSGVLVEKMPEGLFEEKFDSDLLEEWADRVSADLRGGRSVMVAIGRAELQRAIAPDLLSQRLASVVAMVLQRVRVRTILAEGGATAAAIARSLRWTRFAVGRQFASGVVELRPQSIAQSPALVVKAGSYDWPQSVWRSFAGQ